MSESGEVIVDFGAGEEASEAIRLARENPNSSVVAIGLEGEFLRVIKRGSGRVIGSWWAKLFRNTSLNFGLDTFIPTVMEFSSR